MQGEQCHYLWARADPAKMEVPGLPKVTSIAGCYRAKLQSKPAVLLLIIFTLHHHLWGNLSLIWGLHSWSNLWSKLYGKEVLQTTIALLSSPVRKQAWSLLPLAIFGTWYVCAEAWNSAQRLERFFPSQPQIWVPVLQPLVSSNTWLRLDLNLLHWF